MLKFMRILMHVVKNLLLITLGCFLTLGFMDGWNLELIVYIIINIAAYCYYRFVILKPARKTICINSGANKPDEIPQEAWDKLQEFVNIMEKDNEDKQD